MFHLIAFGLCLALYFLPSIVGHTKRNFPAIFILNLLLGWTVIGWIVALVWAFTIDTPVPMRAAQPSCSACHAPIQAGQHYCSGCGSPLSWPRGTPAPGTQS